MMRLSRGKVASALPSVKFANGIKCEPGIRTISNSWGSRTSIKIKSSPLSIFSLSFITQTSLLADYDEFCSSAPQSEISVIELKEKMDNGEGFILIDVREPHEFEIVRIPGARLIPLANFIDGSVLGTLPRNLPIILYCRSGVRSATALAILKEAGFSDATHVRGGVIAWAQQIDTTCAVY